VFGVVPWMIGCMAPMVGAQGIGHRLHAADDR